MLGTSSFLARNKLSVVFPAGNELALNMTKNTASVLLHQKLTRWLILVHCPHVLICSNFKLFSDLENQTENGPVNRTIITTINRTIASPTALRLQDHYVIFYVNAARLLVQVKLLRSKNFSVLSLVELGCLFFRLDPIFYTAPS